MKNVFKIIPAVLIFVICAFGQTTEKFDIITFQIPKGWQKEVQQNAVQLGVENSNGGICLITIFKSLPGSNDSKANFEVAWDAIVKEAVTVKSAPQMSPAGNENGWIIESGAAKYEADGKKGAVILITATGNSKMVNILILTNTDAFQQTIDEFVESASLPKIEKVVNGTNKTTSDQTNARLIGRWNRSGSTTPVYADPVSWGVAGYTKSRYEFRADGSYLFTERSFRYSYQNIIIVKESGKYKVNGNQITISPSKSLIESFSKRNGVDELGSLVKSQNRELETVTYQFTFHYFSGIQEWNLVLQSANETKRDGQFSSLKVFQNAWYFDQKFTDTDLTSVVGN